jgi:hypothetical protein
MNGALGFRVKSGWAAGVLLAGSADSPQLLGRQVIQLCDPAVPESKQPYHAKMGTLQTDDAKIERLKQVIVKVSQNSVNAWLKDLQQDGKIQRAGLVVGSDIDPSKIANPHIRAHALEGRLFRTVLQESLEGQGVSCAIFVERKVYEQAAGILKRSEKDLKQSLTQLGRSGNGPWRGDDKLAALAAWLQMMDS